MRQQRGIAAFYSVSSHGLYGFAFADLGPSFTYQYAQKSTTTSATAGTDEAAPAGHQTRTISDSQSLEAFLASFADQNQKLTWKRRGRQTGKLLFSAFLAQYWDKEEVVRLLRAKGHSGFQDAANEQAFADLCAELQRTWNLAFNPCSSVIGAVMSQEILKVVTGRDHPGHGLFCYDSVNQSMTVERPI